MGLFDGLIDSINCSRWIRYNFEKIFNDYKKKRPDVVLWREYDNRPCPHYIYMIKNDGSIKIEFFQTYMKAYPRFSELAEKQEQLKIKKIVLDVLTQYGSPSITDI